MTPSRHQSATSGTDGAPQVATPRDGSLALGQQHRTGRRFSLAFRNWRVRSKLVAILLVPLLAVLGFAGIQLQSVLQTERQAHHAEQMAQFTRQVVVLARSLQGERDYSVAYMGSKQQNPQLRGQVKTGRDATDRQLREYQRLASTLNIKSLGPVLSDDLGTVDSHVAKLRGTRQQVDGAADPDFSGVDDEFQSFIEDLLALEGEIRQGSTDQELSDAVDGLVALSRYQAATSFERALIGYLITSRIYDAESQTDLFRRDAEETDAKGTVDSTLTTPQRKIYDKALPETITDPVNRTENSKVLPNPVGTPLDVEIGDWYDRTGKRQQALANVEDQFAKSVQDRAIQVGKDARRQAVIDAVLVVLVLGATVALALLTVRSLVRPLRRLRGRALEVAYTELPGAVQRMRDTDSAEPTSVAAAAHVDSRDEVGEVAEAFDSVAREAVRHAGEQAQLRRNVSTMFVNLSRRTQSLVERQLRLIDTLEGTEQDPDNLENLFQLDHLATRMRRNAENLLVLAGAEPGRRWTQPVALIDVLRAAAAEVEQYQRVVHTFVTGREIEGRAVGDVVHLVAELLENASEFSPPDTHVVVSARSMSGGAGVMIEIEDQGIGMSGEDMSTANERLSATAEFEPQLSRMMGLYVVGRLAVRHGIRVQLRPAPSGGLTALIHLPPEVVVDPMAQTGTELPPMTSPMGGPLLGRNDDPAHPGTGMPTPGGLRPDLPTGPALPLPAYGLAGLTAGASPMPRPPANRALPPIMPGGPPQNRFAPPLDFSKPAGSLPGGPAVALPPGPAAVPGGPGMPGGPMGGPGGPMGPGGIPGGPPPLPRREPNAAWPAGGPNGPGSQSGPPDRPNLDTPTEVVRPLLPNRDSANQPAAPSEPEPVAAGMDTGVDGGLDGEGSVTQSVRKPDLDEDTIVPHAKGEDLPIFAELESEWFLRRVDNPLPPPPSLPLEEWGISLDDLPAPPEEVPVEETPAAAQAPSEPAPTGADPDLPALPRRQRPGAEQPAASQPNGGQPADQSGPMLPRRPGAGSEPGGPRFAPAPPLGPPPPGTYSRPGLPPQPGGQPAGQPLAASAGPVPPAETPTWTSPADEGWRLAEKLATPSEEGGTTSAGLPIRVPMAHFVPGAAPTPGRPNAAAPARGQAPRPAPQQRSPEAVRGMLSNYQRGLRQGREAGRHQQDSDGTSYVNQEHS